MLRHIALLLAMLATPTASALDMTPTTVLLEKGQARAELWLHNPGPRTWQGRVRIFAWEQQPGAEQLQESSQILASPTLLELPPGVRQRVWLLPAPAATSAQPHDGELAFRILLEPMADDLPRYSLPLFSDAEAGTRPCLRTHVQTDGVAYSLHLDNKGSLHARLSDLVFEAADGRREILLPGLAGYILAGRQRHWSLPARADAYAGGRFLAQMQDGQEHELPAVDGQIAPASIDTL